MVGFGAGKVLAAGGSKVIGLLGREAEEAGGRTTAARARSLNSFTGSTPVTMADGKQKPIKQVKVGDTVRASDPQTGETAAKRVAKVIVHRGRHTMVDVRLADGSRLTATDRHPFWDASTARFTYATDLKVGDQVSGIIDIGLGRGTALDIFNDAIQGFRGCSDSGGTVTGNGTSGCARSRDDVQR